jgi:hypothetical protein
MIMFTITKIREYLFILWWGFRRDASWSRVLASRERSERAFKLVPSLLYSSLLQSIHHVLAPSLCFGLYRQLSYYNTCETEMVGWGASYICHIGAP